MSSPTAPSVSNAALALAKRPVCPTCHQPAGDPGFENRTGVKTLCSDPFHPPLHIDLPWEKAVA